MAFSKQYSIHDMIMQRPASAFCHRWRDGTPLGNGKTGVLLYGGVSAEHFILNRCDLWYDGADAPVPDVSPYLHTMRQLQAQGKYQEAHSMMYEALCQAQYGTRLADMRALGCVKISFSCPDVYRAYRRVLHMDTAEAEISYRVGENACIRRCFVSRKRDVTVMELQAEQQIDLTLHAGFFQSYEGKREARVQAADAAAAAYRTDGDCYIYSSANEGKFFGIACRVAADGDVTVSADGIAIKNTKHALVFIKAFSEGDDRVAEEKQAATALQALPADYQTLFEEHKQLHEALYRTADLHLYSGDTYHTNEQLLEDARDTQLSAELAEKLWRFGRYLFISGTAQDALPFPLYGVWPCGYEREFTHHVANENVQSIYWHTEVGGLAALTAPLINYYCDRMEAFRENARQLFGCRGFFVGTYTTPKNAAVAWYVPVILHFMGVAGWLSSHFYRYYQFTGDEKLFTEKILPFMVEAAAFYEDYYYLDTDGTLALYPAVSPENSPLEFHDKTKPHSMPVTKNPTVEIAILKELLQNLVSVSAKYPALAEKAKTWQHMLSILPAYYVNEDGAVAEWLDTQVHDAYDHRHLSHLYPVFPGTEIIDTGKTELLSAFKRAVDLREVGSFCGWSLPHMSAIYSRFSEADKAFDTLNALSKVCLLENFFTLGHDYRDMGITTSDCGDESRACVQFDALLGSVNALQEMLLFVTPKLLRLLPACPTAFNAGSATLHFATGTCSMRWDLEKQQCHGTISAERTTALTLELPFGAPPQFLQLQAGERFEF